MPLYFLPEMEEDRRMAPLIDKWMRRGHYEPCWLCKREIRKTAYGYMCWECQETRHIWEAHLAVIVQAEYDRMEATYDGMCQSCVLVRVKGTFECGPCRYEWRS
ncbi:hypothetical protein GTY75_05290 [Streptomyces sp. SID8381]|uniref:hypothetical protein n=1 Tax=unclassified Streptomyces TaxID=2593676 RepID=UPI00037B3348|nr:MULTISPECIES: hypothetical protein [unclassified Streptomyces]MYX26088.1 hypothetical protein [Streptomyces sp. SID8381]